MNIKKGVVLTGVRPEIVLAMNFVDLLYYTLGQDLVITSVLDGKHMENSLHYSGCAFDFRLPEKNVNEIVLELRMELGNNYDVVLESDHIHVEFQPSP